MKTSLAVALLVANFTYRAALPGYRYQFPRDHFSHPDFQTEWWYYTGNLHDAVGHRFGFELTFFRHAVNPQQGDGVFDVRDAWFAHLALSDIGGNRFYHSERLNRAGAGLAGASVEEARVWNGNWSAHIGMTGQRLRAIDARFQFDLTLHPEKPPVIHGIGGVSQKAPGAGHASHYISYTRLESKGTIVVEGRSYTVQGLAWMDHEFFTHQLETYQTGWDWFSLQFEDGSELMLFRIRHNDGSADPYSAGTYIGPGGRQRHLTVKDFTLTPGNTWTSPETHGRYPIQWTIDVPSLNARLTLHTDLPQQELAKYWEGAIVISGVKEGRALRGSGYLEMTGYAGPVQMGR